MQKKYINFENGVTEMWIDEKYILAGIVIGGILFSIVQIFLLKFVEEYRRYAFVLPILLCFIVIGFSL